MWNTETKTLGNIPYASSMAEPELRPTEKSISHKNFPKTDISFSNTVQIREFLPCQKFKKCIVQRQVEDIETIRKTIHAEKLILLSHSYGGTLAVNYMANYPDGVEKSIFQSCKGILFLFHFRFSPSEKKTPAFWLSEFAIFQKLSQPKPRNPFYKNIFSI